MGFASLKTFAVLQLSLLLLGSVVVTAETLIEAHPPSDPPSNHPPSKPVVVEGYVYCKSCKFSGNDALTGATPILGAEVKLKCHNTKHVKNIKAKTNEKGYFKIDAPHTVTTYGLHKCTVHLLSSGLPSCQKMTDVNGGLTLATFKSEVSKTPVSYALYSVGPFAFEPSNC